MIIYKRENFAERFDIIQIIGMQNRLMAATCFFKNNFEGRICVATTHSFAPIWPSSKP